ncbi:hypothetical protein BDW59DRAFT_142113 [Aspergillus cavernicola]|uniref:Arrestin C-terminal-like domain-containing protein n=1 Tax=Aspergillus cavernicola TaxID=176166 RepID=A0ABR4IRL4_9EURO
MTLHRLKGEHGGSQREYVDVQLDKSYVAFQGSQQEALAVYLSGNLVFRFKEPATIKHIRVHLSGVRRVSLPSRTGWKKSCKEEEFYKKSWDFHDAYRTTPEVLPVGDHRYPFTVVLEGSMPESVERMKEASIAYFFTVEIGRKHGRDVSYRKPLHVIRSPTLYDVAMTLDEVWAEKLLYRIHIPSKAVAFGTSLDVNYDFVPLLQDLKIEYIESQLLEVREFAINEDEVVSGRNSSTTTTILSSDRYIIDDNTAECTMKSIGGYQFSRTLHLPKTLGQCVQDTDALGITVKHKLQVNARMQNPDGHVSELRLTIPVSIYLSPYYRVWGGDSFVSEDLPPIPVICDSEEVPPPYGQHETDRLYRLALE